MLWMDQRCAPQSARLERPRAGEGGLPASSLSAAKLRWLADERPGPGPRRPPAVAQGLSAPAPHLRRGHRPQRRRGHGALPASGRGAWDWDPSSLGGVPRRLLPPVRPPGRSAEIRDPGGTRHGLAPGRPWPWGRGTRPAPAWGPAGWPPARRASTSARRLELRPSPPRASPPGGEIVRGFGRPPPPGRPALARDLIAPPAPRPQRPGDAPEVTRRARSRHPTTPSWRLPPEFPRCRGLFFLPHLMGERGPRPDPLARGALVGLTLLHGRGHVVRAVLEGTAFQIRRLLEERLGGRASGRAPPRCGAPWSAGAGPAATCGCASWPTSPALPLRVPAVVEAGVLGGYPGRGRRRGAHPGGARAMVGPARPVAPRPWRRRPLRGPLRALPRPGRPPQPLVSAPGRLGLSRAPAAPDAHETHRKGETSDERPSSTAGRTSGWRPSLTLSRAPARS